MSAPTAPPMEDLPPSYDSAHADQPPSYDMLYGEFRQVDSPQGLLVFVKKAFNWLMGTAIALVVLACLNIVPIGMVVIGAMNKEDCPVNRQIPRWLMTTGVCYLVATALRIVYKYKETPPPLRPCYVRLFDSMLHLFMFVWFILGSVWVFWAYSDVDMYNKRSPHYCDHFTYIFSLIFLIIHYVILAVSCFCFCCCCCCVCFRKPRDERERVPDV